MNIETEHKKQKAHHNVKDRGNKDTLQTALSGAAAYPWQKQEDPDEKLDAAQNGEDVHKVSFFQSLDLIIIHSQSQRRRK